MKSNFDVAQVGKQTVSCFRGKTFPLQNGSCVSVYAEKFK